MTTVTTPLLFSIDQSPFGISYGTWIQKWFHWFYSTPTEVTDTIYDNYDVVFLTSIHDIHNERIKEVNCSIAQDKAILVSVSKWIEFGFPFMDDSKMRDAAKERIDTLEKMTVIIDNQAVRPDRLVTEPFQIEVKRDLISPKVAYYKFDKVRKGKYKALADGYWIFVKPNQLEKGQHSLHTFASCATGVVTLDVRFNIEII